MKNGGKRPGAGRKPGSISDRTKMLNALRDKITDADFNLAIKTLRGAMRQKNSLKVAASVAQFVVEQKIGRAPQNIEHTAPEGFEITIRNVQ